MSCQTKPGPAAFCSFIEDVYQEKVTQADWHAIRELAAAEKGVIKLSRAQCDVDRVSDTALGLADKAAQENGITVDDELSSGGVQFDNRVEEMHESLANTSNTQGTLDVIDYLARHGVLDTLAHVRETKEDGSNTYIVEEEYTPHWGYQITTTQWSDGTWTAFIRKDVGRKQHVLMKDDTRWNEPPDESELHDFIESNA